MKTKYRYTPLFESGELRHAGFRPENIAALVEEGVIERVKHGYYRLSYAADLEEEQLIALLYPDGVICRYSALCHFGYSDWTPSAWDIAVDRNTSKARFNIEYPPINPFYMTKEHLAYGVMQDDFNGIMLNVFDRDRLICEVIRSERKIDAEIFRKAVQAYVNDERHSISRLIEYASKRGMSKRVEERVGIWLV
ncbi:MAG: hypothetical protein RSD45_08270 [Gordonibacter sp.]